MVEYFYSKQAISLFISYLLGRNGPCYIDYVIKSDHWDLARGQIVFSEPLIELVYNLYKKSIDVLPEGKEDGEKKQTKVNILTYPYSRLLLVIMTVNALSQPHF